MILSCITGLGTQLLYPPFPAYSKTSFFTLMVDELDRFFHGHETLFDLTPRSIANRRGSDFSTES